MSSQAHQILKWRKVPDHVKRLGGVVSQYQLRSAVATGKLPAARIGAGRNYLLSDQHVDEWLRSLITPAPPLPPTTGARNARKAASPGSTPTEEQVASPHAIECIGPALIDESSAAHQGFWKA